MTLTAQTPEQDPLTRAHADDPAAVATARTAARTALAELAALENSAGTGGTVTASELVTARADAELAVAGIHAAIRQHAIDTEDARRAALRAAGVSARALTRPSLATLLANVATAVTAYRAAVAAWDADVAELVDDVRTAWQTHDTDVPDGTLANPSLGGVTPPTRVGGQLVGGLVVDNVRYGWTASTDGALAHAVEHGAAPTGVRLPLAVRS